MLYEIVNDFPNEIMDVEKAPYVSLYQPTDRTAQDLIRFKNLLNEIKASLCEKYSEKEVNDIMKPLCDLYEDRNFWNGVAAGGLAVLSAGGKAVIYNLKRPVAEMTMVSDSKFYIKPLIRVYQSADRYQLLGLNRGKFSIYEGDRYGFEEIKMDPETPTTIKEVLGDQYTERSVTLGGASGAGGNTFAFGQGSKRDEAEKDTEKFFRYVDKFVLENFTQPSRLPLLLVSLAEHHTPFRKLSSNPMLMEQGVQADYEALAKDQLKAKAWEILEPAYLAKTKNLVDTFQEANGKSMGSDDLVQIAKAVSEGNIYRLLVEADRIVPGSVDLETGKLNETDNGGDILDDIAEAAFRMGAEVVILPKDKMPSTTGAAATFRY